MCINSTEVFCALDVLHEDGSSSMAHRLSALERGLAVAASRSASALTLFGDAAATSRRSGRGRAIGGERGRVFPHAATATALAPLVAHAQCSMHCKEHGEPVCKEACDAARRRGNEARKVRQREAAHGRHWINNTTLRKGQVYFNAIPRREYWCILHGISSRVLPRWIERAAQLQALTLWARCCG